MSNKIITIALSLWIILISNAFAEQSIANEYRKIFHSGNFYVEFKDNYTNRAIAESDGKRMERTLYSGTKIVMALNPLGALLGGSEAKNPEVMYENGKYYQFIEKNMALMLPEEQINDENLDPRQGWSSIRQKLALPNELSMFFWEDPYRDKSNSIAKPKFIGSSQKLLNNKEYDCDKYVAVIKNIAGNSESKIIYDMVYDNGHLIEVHSYIFENNTEYPINVLKVKKIESVIPKGAFKIANNTKIYAAGVGDIDDLLERPIQVGVIGGSKK